MGIRDIRSHVIATKMRQNSIFVFGEKIDVLEKFKPSEVQEVPDDGLESDWAMMN